MKSGQTKIYEDISRYSSPNVILKATTRWGILNLEHSKNSETSKKNYGLQGDKTPDFGTGEGKPRYLSLFFSKCNSENYTEVGHT
jgi:hypothetical protein